MVEKRTLQLDYPFQGHRVSSLTPSKIQKVTDIQAAGSPSSRRLFTYSPPPVATPTAPKAMLYAALASEVSTPASLGLIRPYEGRYVSDPSITHLSSPAVAPWNEHQARAQQLQCQQTEPYEEPSSDRSTGKQPLNSVETCDNYGCNGFHNHDDCPLEKRCWGCRSPNHFWIDCPMTCKDCESARHIPKHCSDFLTVDIHGMAHPRRPSTRRTPTTQVHLPVEKVFTCDNYGCRDMHSHFDCPLPFICWGCRSTDHFWASCREHCDNCGAKRHTAEYCHEFELWKDGLSRPKRPPQDVITYAMKRQREQEISREQGIELSKPSSKRQRTASSNTKTDSSPTIIKTDREDNFFSCRAQDQYDPKQPAMLGRYHIQTRQATEPYRLPELLKTKRESTPPTPSQDGSHSTRRTFTDIRIRDREYCTFWLRMGRCNYEHTPLGCKYKHEVPDEKTLRAMGIQFVPDWLREKERPPPTSWVYEAPVPINALLQGAQQFFPKPESASIEPVIRPHPRALPTPTTTPSKPLTEPIQQYDRAGSLTPACQMDYRLSTSPGDKPFVSDRMKAFEEEEYFKQKRHEAEMKRKADEQKLEYEHELRMAKLRK